MHFTHMDDGYRRTHSKPVAGQLTFSARFRIALAGMLAGLLVFQVTGSEAIAIAVVGIALVSTVIVLGLALRAHGIALPYTSYTFGSAGTPVYGPVTYTSFVCHEFKAGRCTISEGLEAGTHLENGLINSKLLYGHYSLPPAGPATFEIAMEFAAECNAAAEDPIVTPDLVSENFRDAFRRAGHLLSTRLAMAVVNKEGVDHGFLLLDAERRMAFTIMRGLEALTVVPLEHYPDDFRLEVYLEDLGWTFLWQRNGNFRFERSRAPIALAPPWWRLIVELEVPVFLPQYENRITEAETGTTAPPGAHPEEVSPILADHVYHAGADLLEPDEDSYMLFDMPAGTVLSSFPSGQVVHAWEPGRTRWRTPIGQKGMGQEGLTGEAGLVRMRLINARLARFGLGSLATRRPSALAYAALGVVAGSYAKKVIELVIEPAAVMFAG